VSRLRSEEGKLSFFLLLVMMLCIAWSIELANWVRGLYVVEWTTLGGLAVGFLMTRLRWPRSVGHLVSSIVGAVLVLAVVGKLAGPVLGWTGGVSVVAYHFDAWLGAALSGQSSTDNVTFVLLATLLGWWMGYASAWMVFGAHEVWQALLLSGTTMLLVAYGSPPEIAPFFVLYILCGLLLAIRLYVFTQEQYWMWHHARYDRDISLTFLRDGGVFVLTIVLAVWIVPLLSPSSALSDLWAHFEGPWRTLGDEWNRLFPGVLGYNRGYENVPFGERLALGGAIDLGDDIVMWVDTQGSRYWEGATYDLYDGASWTSSDSEDVVVPANRDLPSAGQYELRQITEQTVLPSRPGVSQVFCAGQAVSVNVPVEVSFDFLDGGGDEGRDPWSAPASVSLMKTRVAVNVGKPYRVFSSVSIADVESLRQAGSVYPEWVSRRYLQLPVSVTERVENLARQIVSTCENPYDQAVAIQDYLRRTIRYREDIPAPPRSQDAVDYLLFESREGYCNYYASAMVVLARAAGIPARLAAGYVGGEPDEQAGRWVVRARDSHAWVEIYFPRYGWVEFEPTASEEPILRPESGEEEGSVREGVSVASRAGRDLDRFWDDPGVGALPAVAAVIQRPSSAKAVMLGAIAVTVIVAASAVWLISRRRLSGASRVSRTYGRMCFYGRLMGARAEPWHTPHEYAAVLAKSVPAGAQLVERIADFYVQDRFARCGVGVKEEQEVEAAWKALRPIVWRRLARTVPLLLRFRLRTGVGRTKIQQGLAHR
jgi:transglutaminase-like putative cysteine protease